MICLAIGLGILAVGAMRCARRHGVYGGFGPGGGWYRHHHHHHHRGNRGNRGRRWLLRSAFARIDASPAQERAIIAELATLEDRVHAARRNVKDVRGDLGAALRGPVLDDAALGGVLGRVDNATTDVRAAALEALRNIHALLDDGQRAQLADLLDASGGGWRGGGWRTGPYR